ncbi:MAG: TlpA disulfide reductase family protein [Pirellulales bacterium]
MLNVLRLSTSAMFAILAASVPAIAQTTPPATAAAPRIPTVVLSKQHAAHCVVKLGAAFPALELTSVTGAAQSLPELYGKPVSVVFFWHGNGWMTRAALRDLGPDIAEPYRKQGVEVVTIAVNQPADITQSTLDQSESKLTTLLDPEGQAFAQIGSEKLPRVYVLDVAGKIVWFDLEYSHSTRRELKQAVEVLVGQ